LLLAGCSALSQAPALFTPSAKRIIKPLSGSDQFQIGNIDAFFVPPPKVNQAAKLWLYDVRIPAGPSGYAPPVGSISAGPTPYAEAYLHSNTLSLYFSDPLVYNGKLITKDLTLVGVHPHEWLEHKLIAWFDKWVTEIVPQNPGEPGPSKILLRYDGQLAVMAQPGDNEITFNFYGPDYQYVQQLKHHPFGPMLDEKACQSAWVNWYACALMMTVAVAAAAWQFGLNILADGAAAAAIAQLYAAKLQVEDVCDLD
jgi:hypothetical protein